MFYTYLVSIAIFACNKIKKKHGSRKEEGDNTEKTKRIFPIKSRKSINPNSPNKFFFFEYFTVLILPITQKHLTCNKKITLIYGRMK